jgi:hypothetical protein
MAIFYFLTIFFVKYAIFDQLGFNLRKKTCQNEHFYVQAGIGQFFKLKKSIYHISLDIT